MIQGSRFVGLKCNVSRLGGVDLMIFIMFKLGHCWRMFCLLSGTDREILHFGDFAR